MLDRLLLSSGPPILIAGCLMPPSYIVCPETLCFLAVCEAMRACVHPEPTYIIDTVFNRDEWGFSNDGHKPWWPQTMTMMATTMTATNRDDQLGEIYPTMLNELNCTFGVSFLRHGRGLFLGLHRISASASANPKFGHFPQIRPNSASAKFLAEFDRRQCNCSAFS